MAPPATDKLQPSWQKNSGTSRGAQLLQRRGVVIVISDFYDAEDETRRELRRVVQRGHDVAMLQLLSPSEIALPFTGQIELEDVESHARQLVDASAIASEYQTTIDAFLDRCRTHALRDGIDYALMTTDMPPEQALRDYLLRRSRRDTSGHTRSTRPA